MYIVAGKQVGPIYYMVKDVQVLCAIVKQGVVRTSLKAEPQSNGGGKYHYVSFMRDLTKASRNPNRWVYGIQLNGDRLSDRYRIGPYSYAGNNISSSASFFRIKTLTAYDNGTYKLNLVNWPAIDIPRQVFLELESLILEDPEGNNSAKNLQITEGTRRINGKMITKKYNYNTKNGGFKLTSDLMPPATQAYLLKHTNMNETEERIWIINDDVKYINIKGCVTGYIEPKGDDSIEQAIDAGLLPELKILNY